MLAVAFSTASMGTSTMDLQSGAGVSSDFVLRAQATKISKLGLSTVYEESEQEVNEKEANGSEQQGEGPNLPPIPDQAGSDPGEPATHPRPADTASPLKPETSLADQDLECASGSDAEDNMASFIKVYAIVAAQVFFSVSIILVFTFVEPLRLLVAQNHEIFFISFTVLFVTCIALAWYGWMKSGHPWDIVFLFAFVLYLAYTTGISLSKLNYNVLFVSFGISVVSMSIFGLISKLSCICIGVFCALASIAIMIVVILLCRITEDLIGIMVIQMFTIVLEVGWLGSLMYLKSKFIRRRRVVTRPKVCFCSFFKQEGV